MDATQVINENGERKVKVTYADGKGDHETTLREIGDRFLQESPEWRKQFFIDLVYKKEAFTRMGGRYQLI